ncbi:MAG: hypothetical protein HQ510_06040 [Candidatus Marinimicrobia bacterium]|nr:hypothetical protein [Candidatus Neomarinimicrobiota bacterium]
MKKFTNTTMFFIIFLLWSQCFAQGIEWIHEYQDGNQGIVEILSDQLIEYRETATHSPPQLVITLPTNKIVGTNLNRHVNVLPLYRIVANEKLYEKSKRAAEITLYFTSLPQYKISTIGENLLRISWVIPDEVKESEKYKPSDVKFDRPVSMNFRNANIVDLLRVLAKQNNLNIIAGQDIHGEVTVSLTDVHLGSALDAILKVNKYDWFIQGNIIVIKNADENMQGEVTTRIYKLDYIDASAIEDAIGTILTSKGKIQAFSPTKGSDMQISGSGGGASGPIGTGGSIAGQSPDATQFGGSGGTASGGSTGTGEYILVTDVYPNFSAIEDMIDQLDIPVKQVNISVKFIETKLSVDEKMGINWKLRTEVTGPLQSSSTGTADSVSALNLANVLALGKWNNMKFTTLSIPAFYGLLEILSTDGDTKLIQEPQVTTKNNTTAFVNVGTTYPILVPQASEGLISQTNTFEDTEINISLNVKPRINNDQFISLPEFNYQVQLKECL